MKYSGNFIKLEEAAVWGFVNGRKHSKVGSDNVPYLNWLSDKPKFDYNFTDNANPNYRALVCDSLSGMNLGRA